MNWMKYKWLYFLFSGLVIVPGIVSLILFGLKPAIDFSGGTILEYQFKNSVPKEEINKVLIADGFPLTSFSESGTNRFLFKFAPLDQNQAVKIKQSLEKSTGQQIEEIRYETVGPTIGKELLKKTIIGVLVASGLILLYVSRQFKNNKFGVCAIIAMFHDGLVLLGVFSLLGHFAGVEVDALYVTAVLTILSFSVHDTVVVYDRIRESQKLFPNAPFTELVNKALTETFVRSLNTSLTIIFMLVALSLLGGDTIRWFVVALLIGAISGAYSSIFNAAPLLVVWNELEEKRKH